MILTLIVLLDVVLLIAAGIGNYAIADYNKAHEIAGQSVTVIPQTIGEQLELNKCTEDNLSGGFTITLCIE